MKAILVAAVVLAIGIAIPLVFIQEKPRLQTAIAECMEQSGGQDPRIAADIHFDYPLQRLLTLKTVVTGEEISYLYVSGYTLFGIELTKARFECEGGGVTTVKGYGFDDDYLRESEQWEESVGVASCDDEFHMNPEAGTWKARLADAGFEVYDVTQLCRLSNSFRTITFKIDEMRLPEAIALFDAEDHLLRSMTFECRGLGGEGAHLYVRSLVDGVITAECPGGHIDVSSEQVYEIDYETFEKKYGFEFGYPAGFDLQLERSDIPDFSSFLEIALDGPGDAIIRLFVNHPGFGIEGVETVLQEEVRVNGIDMFKDVSLGLEETDPDQKIVTYQFSLGDNEFIWFLNTSANDSASEAAFQEIVGSFRFL